MSPHVVFPIRVQPRISSTMVVFDGGGSCSPLLASEDSIILSFASSFCRISASYEVGDAQVDGSCCNFRGGSQDWL